MKKGESIFLFAFHFAFSQQVSPLTKEQNCRAKKKKK